MKKVVIIGKPNVGKSTLFNRLTRERHAIVSPIPNVTRDRIEGVVNWLNRQFMVIDTGGVSSQSLPFQTEIQAQINLALKLASLIIFLVDVNDVSRDDFYVTKLLKKHHLTQVLLVANKAENYQTASQQIQACLSLGWQTPLLISAEHGIGIGDLLDRLVHTLALTPNDVATNSPVTKIVILGKPNVGKSSLVNSILQQPRVLVSPQPHTTRDSILCQFCYQQQKYSLIDTAGIRRKGKASSNIIEKYAVMRAHQIVKVADFILLMIDVSLPLTEQDEIIGGIAHKANLPTIIVLNKWDLFPDRTSQAMLQITRMIRQKLPYLAHAPIVFISALNRERLHTIFTTITKQKQLLKLHVKSGVLTDLILRAQTQNPPPAHKGRRLKMFYANQVVAQLPTFVIFCNNPENLHFTYARYIENEIRAGLAIKTIPIKVYYKAKTARIRH